MEIKAHDPEMSSQHCGCDAGAGVQCEDHGPRWKSLRGQIILGRPLRGGKPIDVEESSRQESGQTPGQEISGAGQDNSTDK